jgi:autotransporter-associated beta strand protein
MKSKWPMNRELIACRFIPTVGGAAIRVGVLLCFVLIARDVAAVTITGSTFASETGGPLPNPKSTFFNIGNPTSVSDSIRSDVQFAHAEAWANATVTCSGVTKSTGGRAWSDAPGGFDSRSTLWNASASGTQVIANYTGQGAPPEFAPFNFVVPGGGIASALNAFPGNNANDPPGYTTPASMAPPASGQGFVVNAGTSGGPLPSFFDIFLQVDATAQQGNGQPVDLFHGTMLFNPNTPQLIDATGGFAGLSPTIKPGGPGQYFVSLPTIQGGTFNAVAGQPFNLNFNVYMTMGDPNHQFDFANPATYPTPFDFSSYTGGPIGAAGGFATQMLVNDPSNFMVSAVPAAAAPVNLTWNGISPVSNWTTGANWLGGVPPVATNVLTFDGNINTVTNNDFPTNTQFNGLTFASSAGPFTLTGNSVLLAGDINDNSPNPQTISLGLVFNGGTSNVNVAPGGALTLGTLTFGAAPQANTFNTFNVNNTVSAASLVVQTNTPVSNTINIANGATLNFIPSGTTTSAVIVGTPATNASPVTSTLTVSGGGTLNIGPTNANFIVGVGSGNNNFGAFNATLDLSGLPNFVYNGSNSSLFEVGVGTRSQGTLKLANTNNTITAGAMDVGGSNATPGLQPPGGGTLGSGFSSNLYLGTGTNTLNVQVLRIGSVNASGNVQFLDGSLGSVVIQGIAAGSPANIIIVGDNTGGTTGGTGQLLLAGHNATVGVNGIAVGFAGSSSSTGVVTFDTGTFNVGGLTLAQHNSGTGVASGTFILGGPAPNTAATGVLSVTGPFNLAQSSNSATADSGTFIINGGTANINTDIVDGSTGGTRTTTLTLAGGTLNMMGHAIGSTTAPITNVNLVPAASNQATLKNLGGAGITTTGNPGGGLVMNGGGQLTLDGVNTYTGNTAVNSGTLSVIGAITQGAVNVNGGTLIGNGNGTTTGVVPQVSVSGGTIRAGTLPGDIGQLAMSSLALNSGGMIVDLGPAFTTDLLNVSGNLTLGGTLASPFAITATGTYGPGQYDIINYNGTLSGTGVFTRFGPLGFTFALDFNTPGKVFLTVSNDPSVLAWSGIGNTNWDFVTPNFTRGLGGNFPYSDPSPVSFNDTTLPGATTINIAAVVSPAIVSVASSTNNYTFQGIGAIAGTGALVKDGTSTLTILTNNTYTGTTTISNGTIQVGNGGTTGSLGSGPIANSGVLSYNRSDVVTVANSITGRGSLQQLGAGTLILTGNNPYGSTMISAGTLQVGNGGTTGSLGTGPISIGSNGTLVFDRSDNVILANAISGSGTLSIAGSGSLTLSGANTLSGGISVNQGTFSTNYLPSSAPAGGGFIGFSNLPAGTIVISGNGTFQYTGSAVTSSDTITLGPPAGTLDASGTSNAALNLSSTAAVAFSSNTSPATFTLAGTSTGANTLAAAIADPGTGANVTKVVKNGTGTWVLTGADTYTGGTVVNHGTLRLSLTGGGVMGGVAAMVNNDATLEVTNSTPALSETPVFNNSMAAAGLLISGTCLEIKSVDGTGTMQVNAGGDVTTDHIIQGALIINGTAGNQGSVTIDASDSSGNPLADGLSLAGSLRPDGPFGAGGSSGGLIGDSTNSGSSFAPRSFSPDISSGAALISSAAAQGNSVPEPSTIALTVLAQLIVTASVARRVRREVARRR